MNKSALYIVLSFIILSSFITKASTVDTAITYSPSMKKNIPALVIKPDGYSLHSRYPVVYLLHGYGNDYRSWAERAPEVLKQADLYQILIVCADGNRSSWYFDSPIDTAWRYETYISSELTNWVDSHYRTIRSRRAKAIVGNSMGGHGALFIALKHPDIFGAAAGLSGGVDIRPFPKNWDIALRLGSFDENRAEWERNTVINLIDSLAAKGPKIMIDCGTEDFFFKVNQNLHEKLSSKNISHYYTTRKGGHNWEYWNVSIIDAARFFNSYFHKSK